MDSLKDRCYRVLKKIGQEKLSGLFSWTFTEEPKHILVDCIEQEFRVFDKDGEKEDFDGLNGLLANPTNWCFHNEEEFYCPVVENDWRSVTLKFDSQIYIKVQKEMIYDYRSAV